MNRQDGGNRSFRDILTRKELAAGRPLYTHVKGPLSMDPFLAARFINGIDNGADKELLLIQVLASERYWNMSALAPYCNSLITRTTQTTMTSSFY
jgi:hypothetical protein